MYLSKTGWEGVDWMHLTQERDQWQDVVNEPSGFIKAGTFVTSCVTISFSRRTMFHQLVL
jgi:hypothetical protein